MLTYKFKDYCGIFSIVVNLWDKNLSIESELSMGYFLSSAKHREKQGTKRFDSIEILRRGLLPSLL